LIHIGIKADFETRTGAIGKVVQTVHAIGNSRFALRDFRFTFWPLTLSEVFFSSAGSFSFLENACVSRFPASV